MPAKPKKIRCTRTTAQGQPCRAWAVHGTDPPICSAHAGLNVGGGAPRGNQNARTHGFYSPALSAQEVADLISLASPKSLDGEIACTRVALRRVLEYVFQNPGQLAPGDAVRALGLAFQGANTVSRLLRDQNTLTGGLPAEHMAKLDEVVTALCREWGIEL